MKLLSLLTISMVMILLFFIPPITRGHSHSKFTMKGSHGHGKGDHTALIKKYGKELLNMRDLKDFVKLGGALPEMLHTQAEGSHRGCQHGLHAKDPLQYMRDKIDFHEGMTEE